MTKPRAPTPPIRSKIRIAPEAAGRRVLCRINLMPETVFLAALDGFGGRMRSGVA